MTVPEGLLQAFWEYERALVDDDLDALDRFFGPGPDTLRGDSAGLLVGHDEIGRFRRARGGAPPRDVVDVRVRASGPDDAVVVAVTAPRSGGHGLQTQAWRRTPAGWVVVAAHVSAPPVTFDRSVWRVVGDPLVSGSGIGPLAGESVAVKDLFAVAGFAVGAGVPAYLAEQPPASEHATAVARLLAAGADLRGIARTDQFAYSLAGDNAHYGTPVNPFVAGGLPGGSSSGCATAVSLGAASIGLATDTAGSVRVPASYQGLWGLRTTHDAVPREGLLPLAPEFDTVGLLTREPGVLARATAVLVGGTVPADGDLFDLPDLPQLDEWAEAFRVRQAWQAWQAHGPWLSTHPDAVTAAVRQRFDVAASVSDAHADAARGVLDRARLELDDLLGDRILVLPSAASSAPRVFDEPVAVDTARSATLRLTCLAGITGRPAVSVPLTTTPTGPVGTCLVGPRGSDVALVARATDVSGG